MAPNWSGNKLPDQDIQKLPWRSRTQKGVSYSCFIAAIIVVAIYLDSITITTKNGAVEKFSLIPSIYQPYAIGYIVTTLILAAVSIRRKSFRTPEIKVAICHYCGATMATSELRSENCSATSAKDQKKNEDS